DIMREGRELSQRQVVGMIRQNLETLQGKLRETEALLARLETKSDMPMHSAKSGGTKEKAASRWTRLSEFCGIG
ncbi:MAG: hypothetical protein ACPGRD_04910, partial [Planktomarina sp.]